VYDAWPMSGRTPTIDDLRRFAVARSLFPPTTLERALERLGFVQADPIRAPARAQDLTLRHRVNNYHAGDLERRYASLGIEEAFFVNYGFVTRAVYALMHPRTGAAPWSRTGRGRARADAILTFVRDRGEVHPREVDAHFVHGRVTNYWGGSSNATTHMLDTMQYVGVLRVVRREGGIRVYGAQDTIRPPADEAERASRLDALADVAIRKYAPMPAASLAALVNRLRYAVPQWQRGIPAALDRAKLRLAHATVDGVEWYWPSDETVRTKATRDGVSLLAPFDPVVWDRRRFELFWGWAYRFEAYTPVKKRIRGYYALPLLWRDAVIGWANLSTADGALSADVGYVSGKAPRDRAFKRALEAELERMRSFLDRDQ